MKLMEILNENIFEFHDQLWRQEIGAAMGSRPVPSYSNIFMAELYDLIKIIATKYGKTNAQALRLLKRFLDYYFLLFAGSSRELHEMLSHINKISPTIQFAMNHTSIENLPNEDKCDCEDEFSIPFLDTFISLEEGKIKVNLYKKGNRAKSIFTPK